MVCLACRRPGRAVLCDPCRRRFRPAADRMLASGLAVFPAFVHEGPARRLVHRLKYEGFVEAAVLLAAPMAERLPRGTKVLVPVPRVRWRRLRYGVDPAAALAEALAARTGLRVVTVLVPAWFGPVHAGRRRERRAPPRLRRRRAVGPGAVLVDDVVTTGITLEQASSTLAGGVLGAVTATSAMTSLIGDGGVWPPQVPQA